MRNTIRFMSVIAGLSFATFEASAQTKVSRLFRATGTHQCQSPTDLGHKCDVTGTDFTSCHDAALILKLRDCCPSTLIKKGKDKKTGKDITSLGGTSIGFTVKCSAF